MGLDGAMAVRISDERFEELVEDALDAIPDGLAGQMDNLAIRVNGNPSRSGLLGLYEGIPLTERDAGYTGMVVPDQITIFQRAICAICASEEEVREQVTITVVHEIAHHFGIDDERLVELGWD